MSKKDRLAEYDDGTYVVKKSKKANILAFILCLLLAIVIWSYAEASEKKKQQVVEDIIDKAAIEEIADKVAETAQDE